MDNKLNGLAAATELVHGWQANDEVVVFTNGCFDLFHAGHVTYLDKAKSMGDRLVIGLNSDASVSALKGPLRPIVPQLGRATVLAGLAAVDLIVVFDDDTPIKLIETLKPDIHVKGGDYDNPEALPEYETVTGYGGCVEILAFLPGFSSSEIIAKVQSQVTSKGLMTDETQLVIDWLKKEKYSRDHWAFMAQEVRDKYPDDTLKVAEALADVAKGFHKKYQDAVVKSDNVLAEFLNRSFDNVDWLLVADAILEGVDEH